MNNYLDFAKQVALQAGEIMLKHFDTDVAYREKQDLSIVTVADEEINTFVIKQIGKTYPEHSVFGEEESKIQNSEYSWLCDPIDGTVPYSKGVPVSVFSLALVKNGESIVGVVYDPFMKRLYSASKGNGAFLNDKPIRVNKNTISRHSIIDIEWWPEASYDIDTPLHEMSVQTACYVLHLGCVVNACCLVASGMYDACVFAGTKGKSVDIAAVKVIVEEAGGKVTDLFGEEQKYYSDIRGAIVSNGVGHEVIVRQLNHHLQDA